MLYIYIPWIRYFGDWGVPKSTILHQYRENSKSKQNRIAKQSVAKYSEYTVSMDDETDHTADASKTHKELLAKGVKHTSRTHTVQSVTRPPDAAMERVASEQTQRILQLRHTNTHGGVDKI